MGTRYDFLIAGHALRSQFCDHKFLCGFGVSMESSGASEDAHMTEHGLVCMYACLSVFESFCLFVCLTVYLFVCLRDRMYVFLS